MSVVVEKFGMTQKGEEVTLYTLDNDNGLKVKLSSLGATIVSVFTKDKNGVEADIVTGFDEVENYENNPGFFGVVVGPYANRTAKAKFSIDEVEYQIAVNENENNLHSDYDNGLHKKVWKATVDEANNTVVFTVESKDGEMGFPGNKVFTVEYSLTSENGLKLHYHATSDKKTPINLTNHVYFNLGGDHSGSIVDTEVVILADQITPVYADCIPTGEFRDVTGTPFDFRNKKAISLQINDEEEQIIRGGGYDHNFVLNNQTGGVRFVASAVDAKSGRQVEVYTDLPGLQLYTGNFMENPAGKGGKAYNKRDGFCMETQFYPNSVNEKSFPDVIYGPEREYDTVTEYRFSVM